VEQVWTLLLVSRLSKLHRLTTREERGTQDQEGRVHQAHQQETSEIWKIPTPEGNTISGPFAPNQLAAAIRRLKPGKFPGLDSIFPDFILKAGSALKSWFCDFLIPACDNSKFKKSVEER